MKRSTSLFFLFFILAGMRSYSQNWTELNSPSSAVLYVCHFVDPNVAFFVGAEGEIIRTENGGNSFTTQINGTTDLYDVFFTDENTGYVVGDYGKILKTVDGGDSWNPQTSPTQNSLRCVRFINANVGFAVGGNCTVLRTDDAGANWIAQNTPGTIDNTIYGIQFLTPTTSIAAGRFGRIYHSTDAGQNWTGETISTEVLLDLYFLNSSTGFVIGNNSLLYKTTNGGTSWTPLSSGSSSLYFSAISFADANHGFIAGGNVSLNMGTITSSNDGGNTWDTEYTGTSRLYDVYVGPKVGYACGLDDSILKYTSDNLSADENPEIENALNVYPNPAQDYAYVALPEEHKGVELTIFDYTGRPIKQFTLNSVSSIYLPIQELAAGQYIVQVLTQKGTRHTKKLIVQH